MMEALKEFFLSQHPIIQALLATTFTWLLTAAGASFVFFFKNMSRKWLDGMRGFTGGVMIAASFWSLLAPSIEMAEAQGQIAWLPAAVGFGLGALFLFALDKFMPHLHINFKPSEKEGIEVNWHRTTLLVLAITLHNIPEGLAVGVAFGAVAAGMPGAELGAMIYVVIEEVVPETQRDKYTDVATLGFIGGFLVMMVLDVALG